MGTKRGPLLATYLQAEAMGLSIPELARVRQQVSAALVNLGEFRLYWVPSYRVVCARSVRVQRAFRVPDAAILVGTYANGIKTRDILDDLAEVIQRTRRPRQIAPPAGEAGAGGAIEAAPMPPHREGPTRRL